MSGESIAAVPLCLPNNFRQEKGGLKHVKGSTRDDIVACEEGLKLLEGIKEPIIVICITGLARTGKSFFLSQLQDGVKFSLGHSTTSHTTGIWIAVSPKTVEREGQTCRIVLLDAEGTSAISSVDDGASEEWDTKVFTLCSLISSVLIYNTKQPTRNDLQQLGFIAKFSDSVCRTPKGSVDKKTRKSFKRFAPKFIWLIRDALLQTQGKPDEDTDTSSSDDGDEEGSGEDWNAYMNNNVLRTNGNDDTSDKVVVAIKHTFSSIQAIGIPPPSTESKICQKLEDPKYAEKVKPFLDKIRRVAADVIEEAEVKKMKGGVVTGEGLAELVRLYMGAINSETKSLPWESMWDTATKARFQKVLDTCLAKYTDTVRENILIPCPITDLKNAHILARNAAFDKFRESASSSTDQDIRTYENQLDQRIDSEYENKTEQNNHKGKEHCRAKMNELRGKYLGPLKKNKEQTYRMFIQAKENIGADYEGQTAGYASSADIGEELDILISQDISLYAVKIINSAETAALSEYDNKCKTISAKSSHTDAALESEHNRLVAEVEQIFRSYVDGHEDMTDLCQNLRKKLDERLADRKTQNRHAVSRECDKEIQDLKSKYWEPKMNNFPRVPFQEISDAKDKIIEALRTKFKGNSEVEDQMDHVTKMLEDQMNRSLKPLVDRAMIDSLRKYSDEVMGLDEKSPCIEEDELFEAHKDANKIALNYFDNLVNGCESRGCDISSARSELKTKIGNLLSKLERNNKQKSAVFNEKIMMKLIKVHLQDQFTAASLSAATSTARSRIFEDYNFQAKGPSKEEVKTQFTAMIDVEIGKIEGAVTKSRAQTAIHVLGTVGELAAWKKGRVFGISGKQIRAMTGAMQALSGGGNASSAVIGISKAVAEGFVDESGPESESLLSDSESEYESLVSENDSSSSESGTEI